MEISKIKIEDLSGLNPSEIIEDLLSRLKDREKDVIIRRHGLSGGEREILEGIGKIHNLTRERVRQIESAGLKKVRESKDKEVLIRISNLIKEIIESHGGIMEKDHLFSVLSHYGLEKNEVDEAVFKNFYNFVILKVIDGFEEVNKSNSFLTHIKLSDRPTDHLEKLVAGLKKSIEEKGKVLTTRELFELAEGVAHAHDFKIVSDDSLDLGKYYQSKYGEEAELVKEKKILLSLFKAAKTIDQNVYGFWGLAHWPEIKPRNLNEKIYLVLKNSGEPMHFGDIAKKIDDVDFDEKKTNIASAHNELILDDKFILVGRGLYGLKEWGLKEGTVAEIIFDIMKATDKPLTREEIIEKVLKERLVKKTTIALALANKNKFIRIGNGFSINEPVI